MEDLRDRHFCLFYSDRYKYVLLSTISKTHVKTLILLILLLIDDPYPFMLRLKTLLDV